MGEVEVWPSSGIAHVGVTYQFRLYTHCGIAEIVDFDGRLWDVASRPSPGTGFPHAYLSFLYTVGTMTLVAPDYLVFESKSGLFVGFKPHEGPKVALGCE
jgi:hypothetical protein